MRSSEKKRLTSVLNSASTKKWAPDELVKGRYRTEQCVYSYQAYGAAPLKRSSSQPGPATRGHAADRSPAPRSSAPPPQRGRCCPQAPQSPSESTGSPPPLSPSPRPVRASGPAQTPLRPPPPPQAPGGNAAAALGPRGA